MYGLWTKFVQRTAQCMLITPKKLFANHDNFNDNKRISGVDTTLTLKIRMFWIVNCSVKLLGKQALVCHCNCHISWYFEKKNLFLCFFSVYTESQKLLSFSHSFPPSYAALRLHSMCLSFVSHDSHWLAFYSLTILQFSEFSRWLLCGLYSRLLRTPFFFSTNITFIRLRCVAFKLRIHD